MGREMRGNLEKLAALWSRCPNIFGRKKQRKDNGNLHHAGKGEEKYNTRD